MTTMTVDLECTLPVMDMLFPRTGSNCAATGLIPIEFFDKNEVAIREMMKANRLKAIYRGPRLSNNLGFRCAVPSMTRRCDATGVLLYRK